MGYYDDEYYDPYYDHYMHTGEFSEYFEDSDEVYDDEYYDEEYDEIVDDIEGEFVDDIGEAVCDENGNIDFDDRNDVPEGADMDADDGFKQMVAQLDAVIYQLQAQIRENERLAKVQQKEVVSKCNSVIKPTVSHVTPTVAKHTQTKRACHTLKSSSTHSAEPLSRPLSFWQRLKRLLNKKPTPKSEP